MNTLYQYGPFFKRDDQRSKRNVSYSLQEGGRRIQLPTWLNMPRTLCLSLSLCLSLGHGHSGPCTAGPLPGPGDALSVLRRLTSGRTTMHWSASAGTTLRTASTACGTPCPHCKGKRLVEAWLWSGGAAGLPAAPSWVGRGQGCCFMENLLFLPCL